MAKDRKKLQHIHSSIVDKQPTPQTLEVGEIAVNNAANQEFLSIKNTDDKVVRFSSDGQIIEWIERKEVMPYEGYTRGSDGPDGSTGPDSVTNDDLLQNKSNIIIKLNQVAASATTKHDKVNGAKDIYNKEVNPTNDGGVTDGAGFAIDMSRYAMIGANPSFSSLTVTDKTDLSGNTTITDGDGTGTRTGKTFTVNVTNENETVANLNESATTRTTIVGTENLTVSGTTTEVHNEQVTITNNNGVTETTKGNVVENVSGTTTINHSGTTTTNVSADTVFNTTGTTTINSTGSTTIQSTGDDSDVTIYAKDDICETSDNVAAFKGANKTNVGIDCSDAGRTNITNIYGDTINERANTADTRVTSAYTSATTATTVIDTANTSATTATLSGNTLVVNEAGSISAKTPTTYLSGTTLDINETNTTISSCGKVDITTDKYSLKQCSNSGGTADFEFCNGFNVKSNTVKFEQCGTDGSFTINENNTSINGETLTIRESGATDFSGNTLAATTAGDTNINIGGNLTENITGNTTITSTGTTTIQSVGDGSDICIVADDVASLHGGVETRVGKNCAGEQTPTLNINGTTINETGTTVNEVFTNGNFNITNYDLNGDKICLSGATNANFYGKTTNIGVDCDDTTTATTINVSGTTINEGGKNITINTTEKTCIQAGSNLNIGGDSKTNVGTDCNGNVYSNETNVLASSTINVSAPTTIISGTNLSIDESNIDIDSCGSFDITTDKFSLKACTSSGVPVVFDTCAGFDVNSDKINLVQCSENGSITVTEKTQTVNGGTLTINESGNTTINVGGNFANNITGDTTFITTGDTSIHSDGRLGISSKGELSVLASEDNIVITANKNLCEQGGNVAAFVGVNKTNIGADCDGDDETTELNIKVLSTKISANTITQSSEGATTVNVGGNLTENVVGNLTENITGNTLITTTGITDIKSTDAVGISSMSSGVDIYGKDSTNIGVYAGEPNTYSSATTIVGTNVLNMTGGTTTISSTSGFNSYTTGNTCVQSTSNMNIGGDATTNIGTDCNGNVYSDNVGVSAQTGVTINGGNNVDIKSPIVNISGGTNGVNISGATRISGATTIGGQTTINNNLIVTGSTNITGATTIGGQTTINNNLTVTGNTNTSGNTSIGGNANITGATTIGGQTTINNNLIVTGSTNTSGNTSIGGNANISGSTTIGGQTTINNNLTVTGSTNISGNTTVKGTLTPLNGLSKTLSWSYGDVRNSANGSTNFKDSASFTIPKSIDHLSNWNGSCINLPHNVCVNGTITADNAIYSSDKNMKENIVSIKDNDELFEKAAEIDIVSFNFKDREDKATKYGVIAQDVQEIGLNELVKETNGKLGVDYTSLLMLKIAYLENTIKKLTEKIEKLENK